MNPDDVLRSLFGFPKHNDPPGRQGCHFPPPDSEMFGERRLGDNPWHHEPFEFDVQAGDNFNFLFGSSSDIMLRHFEEIFRGLGMELEQQPFAIEQNPLGQEREQSPRSQMLKQSPPAPWQKDRIFGTWGIQPDDKRDKDMDDEVKAGVSLDQILSPDPSPPPLKSPTVRSHYYQSVMVRGPDGKVEQRRTVRDGSGNEETTITRTLGDQSYTVTTRSDPTGRHEKHEELANPDEGNISDFQKRWQDREFLFRKDLPKLQDNPPWSESSRTNDPSTAQPPVSGMPTAPRLEQDKPSLFKKFFGNFFKDR